MGNKITLYKKNIRNKRLRMTPWMGRQNDRIGERQGISETFNFKMNSGLVWL
jgi:hypothetical protein